MDMILIVLIVLGIPIGVMIYVYLQNQDALNAIKNNFGMKPEFDERRQMKSVEEYHRVFPSESIIDDTTWNDLDMDAIYLSINNTQSTMGETVLYSHLRNQGEFNRDKLESAVKYFTENPEKRYDIQKNLNIVDKNDNAEVLTSLTINHKAFNVPYGSYSIMRIAMILGIVLLFVRVEIGLPLIVLTYISNYLLNEKFTKLVSYRIESLSHIMSMIRAAKKFNNTDELVSFVDSDAFKKSLKKFGHLNAIYSFALPKSSIGGTMEGLFNDLVNVFFLITPLAFRKVSSLIDENVDDLLVIYDFIGYLDMSIAIASYRKSLTHYCHIEFDESLKAPDVVNVKHPLIEDVAVGNTIRLPQYNIITGSNASGKSTFVRAVTINALLGQRINTCTAESFAMRPSFIITSMAIRDDVESGDSYFVSETKSIKRILENVSIQDYSLVVIDEILKGTNTIERISASASVLNALSKEACCVLAATHDIELTEMLSDYYTNSHFRETITDHEISFDYIIKEGPSNTRNAIKLLEIIGYDKELIDLANELAQEFKENRKWKKL